MSNITTHESRKKVVASAMIGGLLSLTLVGGTYAGLATSIATTAETESFTSSLTYLYEWTIAAEPIDADITPVTSPVAEVFTKNIENKSSVASNIAFWATGVDISTVPDSLLDETTVRVIASNGTKSSSASMSLRQFLTNAVVFDATYPDLWNGNLASHTDLVITVEVTAANNLSPADFSDAIGYPGTTFNTNVTFNQIIGGSSDLVSYAKVNGTSFKNSQFPYNIAAGWLVPLVDGALTY